MTEVEEGKEVKFDPEGSLNVTLSIKAAEQLKQFESNIRRMEFLTNTARDRLDAYVGALRDMYAAPLSQFPSYVVDGKVLTFYPNTSTEEQS